jgi:hypothetical protein
VSPFASSPPLHSRRRDAAHVPGRFIATSRPRGAALWPGALILPQTQPASNIAYAASQQPLPGAMPTRYQHNRPGHVLVEHIWNCLWSQ